MHAGVFPATQPQPAPTNNCFPNAKYCPKSSGWDPGAGCVVFGAQAASKLLSGCCIGSRKELAGDRAEDQGPRSQRWLGSGFSSCFVCFFWGWLQPINRRAATFLCEPPKTRLIYHGLHKSQPTPKGKPICLVWRVPSKKWNHSTCSSSFLFSLEWATGCNRNKRS